MVRVICINNDHYPVSLQLNKEYEAKEYDNFYIIIADNLEPEKFSKDLFKIVE